MFVDTARIFVQAGRGGNGCVSFRREKFIPLGGPDGTNGGKGGDIYLLADKHLSNLLEITHHPHYKAQSGQHGQGGNRYARAGQDLVIRAPVGTVVFKETTNSTPEKAGKEFLADLDKPGKTFLAARGGRGGRGNASFKTQKNKAPKIAEKGVPGENATLALELKIFADIGLVGMPNAGKSTFLSRVSNAHPKIADYPFTTLKPQLGAVLHKGISFIVAASLDSSKEPTEEKG